MFTCKCNVQDEKYLDMALEIPGVENTARTPVLNASVAVGVLPYSAGGHVASTQTVYLIFDRNNRLDLP